MNTQVHQACHVPLQRIANNSILARIRAKTLHIVSLGPKASKICGTLLMFMALANGTWNHSAGVRKVDHSALSNN
jgi:hypothetical protein